MSNNSSISKLYQSSVLSAPIEVYGESVPTYVNLSELYGGEVLKQEYKRVPIELTEEYLTILQILEEEAEARARNNPTPKPLGPYRLTLNQRRAIFDTMSKEQYNNILTNKAAARSFAAQVATVQRNDKYNKALRDSLGLEEGVDSPADGGSNVDIDYIKWINYLGKTDSVFLANTMNYILTIKGLGLWNNIVTYPLATSQNIGSGTKALGLGNLGNNIANPNVNQTALSFTSPYYGWTAGGLNLSAAASDQNGTTFWQGWQTNNLSNNFTLDTWVTFTGLTGTYNTAFFTNEQYQTNGFRAGLTYNGGSTTNCSFVFWSEESGGTVSLTTPNNSIQLGKEVNITLTYNATTSAASIYLNGVLSTTGIGRIVPPTNNALRINGLIVGTVDTAIIKSLALYNTPLNANQVKAMYNLNKSYLPIDQDYLDYIQATGITNPTYQTRIANFITGIKDLGLWEYMVAWPMRSSLNKGSGNTVYSLGGYGTYNGTMVNNAKWTPGGITFTSQSDYIDYGTFNVNMSGGGFNVHTLISGLGVPVTYTTTDDSFNFFSSSDGNSLQNQITNKVGGGFTWEFQSANYNAYRIYDLISRSASIATDVGLTYIADNSLSTTLSTSTFQFNGITTNGTGKNYDVGAPKINGNRNIRTFGRSNTTNAPYPNSRMSYLLVFAPTLSGFGDNTPIRVTSQTMSAVYTLCQNTLNQGDPDVEAYVATTGATDSTISTFVSGIKAQGLWYNMVSWPLISTQNIGTGSVAYPLGGLYGGGLSLSGTLVNGPTWSLSGVTSLLASAQGISSTIGSLTLSAQSLFTVGRTLTNTTGAVMIARNSTGGTQNGMNMRINDASADIAAIQEQSGETTNSTLFVTSLADNSVFRARLATATAATSAGFITRFDSTPVIKTITLSGSGPLTNTDPLWIGRRAVASGTNDNQIAFASVFTSDISPLSSTVYNIYKSTLGANLNLP
jgi:hypothetical protein